MLPVTEFQFAFCGFATFAATVGYACTKRFARPTPTLPDVEAGSMSTAEKPQVLVAAEETSLKRKLTEDTDEPSECDRPQKRNKTPTLEDQPAPPIVPEVSLDDEKQETEEPDNSQTSTVDITADTQQPPEDEQQSQVVVPDEVPAAPAEAENVTRTKESGMVPTPPPSPLRPSTPAFATKAFSAYVNAGSFFPTTVSSLSQSDSTPAWRRSDTRLKASVSDNLDTTDKKQSEDFSDRGSPRMAFATKARVNAIETEGESVSASVVSSVTLQHSLITGEEDETVESELKGVKVFIKRGKKEFTDGIYGHIKVLKHTKHHTDRLLFRREPLGQVSVNVKLRPEIHCAFDAQDNILRVIQREALPENVDDEPQEGIVVYAFKPGRASKADFKAFAEVLLANEHLKSRSS